jgi:hypothetical protein
MSIDAAIARIDQILLTTGPYAGRYACYAEGVTPAVSVRQNLTAGQPVATIIDRPSPT